MVAVYSQLNTPCPTLPYGGPLNRSKRQKALSTTLSFRLLYTNGNIILIIILHFYTLIPLHLTHWTFMSTDLEIIVDY